MGLMTNLKCIHILTALVYSDIFYVSEIITMQMYIRKENLLSSAGIHHLFTTTVVVQYKLYCCTAQEDVAKPMQS